MVVERMTTRHNLYFCCTREESEEPAAVAQDDVILPATSMLHFGRLHMRIDVCGSPYIRLGLTHGRRLT